MNKQEIENHLQSDLDRIMSITYDGKTALEEVEQEWVNLGRYTEDEDVLKVLHNFVVIDSFIEIHF